MQFSEHWLRTLINPALDSEALAHCLTMAGLEVEERNPVAPPFSGLVVARILSAEPHPNADRLRVCQVDDGSGEPLQIVCGAPNAAAGLTVPLARIGAQLPGDLTIKAAKLRGVASSGMLCSARELGLSQDHSGLMELSSDLTPGTDIRTALHLDDHIFVIKLTPNRADCLSLVGIARELSAITGAPAALPDCAPVAVQSDARREIALDAPAACPRLLGRVLTGVNARAASPEWMQTRLLRSGIRPISAIVDITNYVMLELGQPLHAYDNARLKGAVRARMASGSEAIEILNGQTITPAADTLLIADDSGPLGLAGIMGGEHSGITLDATEVFLEAAHFAPAAIAGRAIRHGFSSDASHRFERGVDPDLPARAIERASALILEICGGQAGPVLVQESPAHLPVRAPVTLQTARVKKLLGIDLDEARICELFTRDHLTVSRAGEGALTITAPSYRFDIECEADLIEEIARLHGYDNIPAPLPEGQLAMLERPEAARPFAALLHHLVARDYFEAVNYTFIDEADQRALCPEAPEQLVRLANPIASQMSVMRTSLLPGLLASVINNLNRQQTRVRLFECGRVFLLDQSPERPVPGYHQPLRLGLIATGAAHSGHWQGRARSVDFYDLKGDIETLFPNRALSFRPLAEHPALHPGRAATIVLDGQPIGFVGELHPAHLQAHNLQQGIVAAEIDLEHAQSAALPRYREFSRQPIVTRDIAFTAPATLSAAELLDTLRQAAGDEVLAIELFDVYQGEHLAEGQKSLAFRVLLQDTHKTLEDAQVEALVCRMREHACTTLGITLRS